MRTEQPLGKLEEDMTQDAKPSGASIRQRVVGGADVQRPVQPDLRGALNLGWTVDELREALLQISGYAGFPAAHEALDVLSEIVTEG